MKVGFIGLGRMGSAMADRILGGGHEIAVYNRSAAECADLVSRGAKLAETVAEAAGFGDVVITMLENDAALSSVVTPDGGLLGSLPKSGIHLAMGTHSVAMIGKLTETHAKADQVLVSAPVMGRPPVAAAGQLGILTGGPPAAVEKCQPLFAVMGRRTFDCGPAPAGAAAAKIANNAVLACAIEAMAESFALAEKSEVAGFGLSRNPYRRAIRRPGLQDLRKIDRGTRLFRRGRLHRDDGLEGRQLGACGGRDGRRAASQRQCLP